MIIETGFFVDPCEETLQACVRLAKKYSDCEDYFRATPLLILMGYYDTLRRGFVAHCVNELYETKDSWNPRPYVLHYDHEIEFLDILWREPGFKQEFNLSMVYSMRNNRDIDVMKRLRAFSMREARMKKLL